MNNIDYKAVVEILENFLKKEKTEILGISVGEEHQLRQAIENLIQEYKELKEERKLAYNLGYRNGCNDTSKFNDKEFIRKSKVKEKIDKIQELQINYVDGITFGHIILELEELLKGE